MDAHHALRRVRHMLVEPPLRVDKGCGRHAGGRQSVTPESDFWRWRNGGAGARVSGTPRVNGLTLGTSLIS
jgi:hypothetical protein